MVRATARGFRCMDCGRELTVHEAIVCEVCDREDLDQLRALLAPAPPTEASPRTS